MAKYVIFTDLDGTLLDFHTYSFKPAKEALGLIKASSTPLVIVSSKTRLEILELRTRLKVTDPFVPENGAAVFIPSEYDLKPPAQVKIESGYSAITLGWPRQEIITQAKKLKEKFQIQLLSEMTVNEIIQVTGLDSHQAKAAGAREFGEAFVLLDDDIDEAALYAEVENLGLNLTKGNRFYHFLAGNDKGRAVELLMDLYRKKDANLISVGLGDSDNDFDMLKVVDKPYLVAKPDMSHTKMDIPGLTRVQAPGPSGFNQAVTSLLAEKN